VSLGPRTSAAVLRATTVAGATGAFHARAEAIRPRAGGPRGRGCRMFARFARPVPSFDSRSLALALAQDERVPRPRLRPRLRFRLRLLLGATLRSIIRPDA